MAFAQLFRFCKSLWYWLIKLFYVLISQAFLTALCLCVYTGTLTVFYYRFKTEVMSAVVSKYGCQIVDENLIDKWRFCIFAFGVIYVTVFRWIGVKNSIARQFIVVSEIVFVMIWAIIIINCFNILAGPYTLMLILDSGTALATLMIIINAVWYGFHKNE